jgi:hypothetical protein
MFAQRPAKVALEDGQAPVRARRLAAGMARDGVAEQIGFAARIDRALLARGEPVGVQRQVTPIRRERVRAQAVLDPGGIDEAIDRGLAGRARGAAQALTPASASAA